MMKAIKIKKPLELEITNVPIPKPTKGHALLKLLYGGICGSDVALYIGNQPFATYPRIPGHEFSAEIIEVEKNDRGLKPGMIVTANPYFNCGKCYPCRNGRVNCCENNQTMGVQRDGAFSEYVLMPIDRIIDGKGVKPEILALVEPFCVSYHAIKRGNIKPENHVLIMGAGPIGIFAMIAAKMYGATVYIADMLQKRLDMAMQMGADHVINVSNGDLSEKIAQLTNDDGVDVCIEAVGIAQTFLSCIENVCFSGKVILIGNGKTETTFNHSIVLKKELNIYGSRNSLNEFEHAINMINMNRINISNIVTHKYDINDASKAFEDMRNNDGTIGKMLLKF
jgi:2-desacetyl-2-hydroxyethyl bacteriochlorophyllide A dehydrogenase